MFVGRVLKTFSGCLHYFVYLHVWLQTLFSFSLFLFKYSSCLRILSPTCLSVQRQDWWWRALKTRLPEYEVTHKLMSCIVLCCIICTCFSDVFSNLKFVPPVSSPGSLFVLFLCLFGFEEQLEITENKILDVLSTSQGNILDDEEPGIKGRAGRNRNRRLVSSRSLPLC